MPTNHNPPSSSRKSSGNFITQVLRVFSQPIGFFYAMPMNHHWVLAAFLILAVTGYTATTEIQSTSSSVSGETTLAVGEFDMSVFEATATQTTAQAMSTQQTTSTTTTSDEALMNALLAASSVIIMWGGQAGLLSLTSMFQGYAPQLKKSFQIAIWASLPLALMLILRTIHYSAGGTGGDLGLSLLLEEWQAYTTFDAYVRRVLAVFFSNFTLFWLWNIVLLYFGARYALQGQRFTAVFVVALWIIASTIVPAFVTEPQTQTAPAAPMTTQSDTENEGTNETRDTTTEEEEMMPGGFEGGFPGGEMPSGAGGGPPGQG